MRTTPKKADKQQLRKIRKGNEFVNKESARLIAKLFATYPPTLTKLLTELLTIENQQLEELKTEAARKRTKEAFKALQDCINYGWHYGLAERDVPNTKIPNTPSRRLRTLFKPAMQSGRQIAINQLGKITALRHNIRTTDCANQSA